MAKSTLVISPQFKIVFWVVAAFTLLFFITALLMTIFITNMNQAQQQMATTGADLCKMGFGAIVGLIGGKAL